MKIVILLICCLLTKIESKALTMSQQVFTNNSSFLQNDYNEGNGGETFADAEGSSCYIIYAAKLDSITSDLGVALGSCLALYEIPLLGLACMVLAYKSASDKRQLAQVEFEDCINNQKH